MDAATVVLGCLLSHPRQPFALGVGLVPEVGEEDEEDGPINPDKVDEDGELVLAAGHEVILGDVDRDDHELSLGIRQRWGQVIHGIRARDLPPQIFISERRRLLAHPTVQVKHDEKMRSSQQQLEETGMSLKAVFAYHPPSMALGQQAEQHPCPVRGCDGAELLETQGERL